MGGHRVAACRFACPMIKWQRAGRCGLLARAAAAEVRANSGHAGLDVDEYRPVMDRYQGERQI